MASGQWTWLIYRASTLWTPGLVRHFKSACWDHPQPRWTAPTGWPLSWCRGMESCLDEGQELPWKDEFVASGQLGEAEDFSWGSGAVTGSIQQNQQHPGCKKYHRWLKIKFEKGAKEMSEWAAKLSGGGTTAASERPTPLSSYSAGYRTEGRHVRGSCGDTPKSR